MSYERPTLPVLAAQSQADIESRLPGANARIRARNLDVLARMFAGGLDGVYGAISWLAQQIMPQTATGLFLVYLAALRNIFPRLPSPSSGPVTVVGPAPGAVLPAGTVLNRGDNWQFVTTADITIGSGLTGSGSVSAVTPGSGGDTDAGQTLTPVSPVGGIASVTVATGGLTDGEDAETEEELRARLIEDWQEQPQGGAAWDYIKKAKTVPGVTRSWVFPSWMGLGTVGVSFVMDGNASIIPDSTAVALVTTAVTDPNWRPVTADVYVFAPASAPLNITIHLDPDTAAVRASVNAALAAMVAREQSVAGAWIPPDGLKPAGLIKLGKIWGAITAAAGAGNATLVSPSADFQAPSGQLPQLGTVTFA